jgi:hypothetical protein
MTLEPGPRDSTAKDEVEVTLSDSLPMEEHFDDLQALEDELASVTGTPAAASAGGGGGRSDAILARIEEELRSIRTDLTELKKELSGLRKPGKEPGPASPTAGKEKAEAFFDEEEDETIALTGDELDNILNTAEITEGTAGMPGPEAESLLGDGIEPGILSDTDAASPADDILDYDTPVLEEDRIPAAEPQAGDEDILELESEPGEPEAAVTDLAADLVLEQPSRPTAAPAPVDAFADLELEGLPEMELEEAPQAPPVPKKPAASSRPAEAGEPAEMEAPGEMEAFEELEAADDLEAVAEIEGEPAGTGAGKDPAEGVDLEALALEAQEPGDTSLLELENELELAELEPVAEDKEIRIDFEAEPSASRAAGKAEPDVESLEVEELVEAAEPAPSSAAAAPAAAAGRTPRSDAGAEVPEDLKDEIRAVLKYMDHLLEALPEEKIQEFAGSDYFVMYKKLFEELGLGD